MSALLSPDQIAAIRKGLEDMENASLALLGPCPPDLKESTIDIPLADGFVSRTILIRPVSSKQGGDERVAAAAPAATEKLPLVVFIHGGSFSYDSPRMLLSPARAFASHFRAIVACIAYKLAPEHPFPAPAHSAWEATAWLAAPENLNSSSGVLKAEGLEFDPALGFVLAGASAGANLAAAIAGVNSVVKKEEEDEGHHHDGDGDDEEQQLVRGLPPITSEVTGLFLAIPYLMEAEIVPAAYRPLFRSREANANAPFINARSLEEMASNYQQDVRSPWFSPLNLDVGRMRARGRRFPGRVYVQCGDLDIIRDDAVVYERALRDAGLAETRIDVMPGYDHACWCNLMFDQAHTPEMKERTMDGMGWLLGSQWDRARPLSH
ncbi:hypothetical protein SLS62_002134 [Diatrype stigma]|uniref:Alpha/beta hydrolase fold-3 domain-containing protein n=1 Tax=Diatrype stigma TaxID=117547 RepID=A0AAN9UX22_9PEZI